MNDSLPKLEAQKSDLRRQLTQFIPGVAELLRDTWCVWDNPVRSALQFKPTVLRLPEG